MRQRRSSARVVGASALIACCLAIAVTAGCSPPVMAGPDQGGRLDFGGLTRTYTLHVPDGLTDPTALVVNLHGTGSTGRGQQRLTRYDAVADAHGFVVVYPDGVDRGWADGRGSSAADQRGIDDIGFITALVTELVNAYGIPPGRVFATGFSNGAFMSDRLACERADVFAAVAPVAGTIGADVGCSPSRPVAVLSVHGTDDPLVPFDGGSMTGQRGQADIVAAPAMAQRWRDVNGCREPATEDVPPAGDGRTEVHVFTSGSCAPGGTVVFVQVDGGGHTWPGGGQYLPEAIIGSTTRAFDASAASGDFFSRNGR